MQTSWKGPRNSARPGPSSDRLTKISSPQRSVRNLRSRAFSRSQGRKQRASGIRPVLPSRSYSQAWYWQTSRSLQPCRLAGQPAMAVRADIQEGDDLAVHVADQERLAEHVTGEEVSGLAQLRCRADQVPGRQEQPIDLELVEVRIVVVMGRKQVAQARFMQEHESTPQQTSAWLPPGRKGQSSSVNGTGWAPKMQPDLPGFSISA